MPTCPNHWRKRACLRLFQRYSNHEENPFMSEPHARISTGNAQADEILSGGFPANSINLIIVQPGSGKTVFAEQLAFHNASRDSQVLYLTTLSEPVSKVVKYAQRFPFFDPDKIGSVIFYEDIGTALTKNGIGV